MRTEEIIERDIRDAMKQKDALRLSVLRMMMAAVHNRAIEKRAKGGEGMLTEEEVQAVLRTERKKRRESMQEFEKGGRLDLSQKEAAEAVIIEAYLPPALSDEELAAAVHAAIAAVGAHAPGDFGRVMSEVMKRTRGQEGDRVAPLVRKFLNS